MQSSKELYDFRQDDLKKNHKIAHQAGFAVGIHGKCS